MECMRLGVLHSRHFKETRAGRGGRQEKDFPHYFQFILDTLNLILDVPREVCKIRSYCWDGTENYRAACLAEVRG